MATPAHRIGPPEDSLLVVLARYVRATAEQLTRHSYSPNSLRYVRKRLARLVEAGYVDANVGFSQNGKPPNVYSPTMQGWRYAEDRHGLPIPHRWRPSEAQITDYRDYLHDLAITDTGIAIERFCREAEPLVSFVQFLHDRFLPQTKVPLPDGTNPSIRLDGFVELHIRREDTGRQKQRCHLIEIDRGTHYEKALRKKVLIQIQYVQGGHYERDFGTQSLTYLWICPGGAERVTYLRRVAEATLREHNVTDFAPLFLFTAEDPATADPVSLFTRPCWTVPFEPAPVALLAFPPPLTTVRLDRTQYLSPEAYDQFLRTAGETVPIVASELDVR
jgi:hypothetical protein